MRDIFLHFPSYYSALTKQQDIRIFFHCAIVPRPQREQQLQAQKEQSPKNAPDLLFECLLRLPFFGLEFFLVLTTLQDYTKAT